MAHGALARTLSHRVEQILTAENLLKNPVFCAYVTDSNTIPLSLILSDPVINSHNVTYSDIMSLLNLGTHVQIRYQICKNVLVFKNAENFVHQAIFVQFVRMLTGVDAFDVERTESKDYIVRCRDPQMAIALWRASKNVPLNGVFLEVEMGSILTVKTREETKNRNPKRRNLKPRRHNENNRRVYFQKRNFVHIAVDTKKLPALVISRTVT